MSEEQRSQTTAERIARVLWFFLCISGANAALGQFFRILQLPNDALYLQLGCFMGAAAMAAMGLLQLVEALISTESPTIVRVTKGWLFVLNLCGAAVIVAMYLFEVAGKTGLAYGQFLLYALVSVAAALLVTGTLKLGEAFALREPGEEDDGMV
jgi:hypothetical protein